MHKKPSHPRSSSHPPQSVVAQLPEDVEKDGDRQVVQVLLAQALPVAAARVTQYFTFCGSSMGAMDVEPPPVVKLQEPQHVIFSSPVPAARKRPAGDALLVSPSQLSMESMGSPPIPPGSEDLL